MRKEKLLNISQITELEQAKLMYRVKNGYVGKRIVNKVNSVTTSNHNYNTRQCKDPCIPIHKTGKYSKSFLVQSPKVWMKYSQNIQNTKNIKTWSKRLKTIILDSVQIH